MEKKEYSAPEIQAIKIDSTALLDGGLGINSKEGYGEFSKEMDSYDIPLDEDDEESDD